MTRAFGAAVDTLITNVASVVRGKNDQVRMAVCCLLTEGHLLIEDVPGTGKTSLAKAIAGSIDGTWKRVQFTPDLLPTDITGVAVFDQPSGQFRFREGPVFTNVLIGDEINRGSPKTQSALLEVMEERQVTVDGRTHLVPRPFFVVATQNPRDFHGTFPLPEVQLDRFSMRISLGYLDPATEASVIDHVRNNGASSTIAVSPVMNTTELAHLIESIRDIQVAASVSDYVVRLANATRQHPDLRLGVSTRGTISMVRVASAFAATDGRDFVTPDDVRAVLAPVFAHRMALTAEAELRGVRVEHVVAEIADDVSVPRNAET